MGVVQHAPMSRVELPPIWVSCSEVCRTLGIHYRVVKRFASQGRIRTRTVSGLKPRYNLVDALGLLEQGGSA